MSGARNLQKINRENLRCNSLLDVASEASSICYSLAISKCFVTERTLDNVPWGGQRTQKTCATAVFSA